MLVVEARERLGSFKFVAETLNPKPLTQNLQP